MSESPAWQNDTVSLAERLGAGLEGEAAFHQLLNEVPVGIYTCDKEGYITYYNACAVEIWGRSPALGKERWCGSARIYTLDRCVVAPEDCYMAQVVRGRQPSPPVEAIVERADGTQVFVRAQPKPLFDPSGAFVGAVNIMVDISSQKAGDEKAAMLATIVESSNAGIVSKTLDGVITSWNKAAEHIFGYSEPEILGRPITMLIPPERLQEEAFILEQQRSGRRIDHLETQRIRKDGRIIDVSLTISPVRDSSGRIIGASKIVRDITAAKESERRLREGEERFRMAVASTSLGTWDHDLQTGMFSCSAECLLIFGISQGKPATFADLWRLIHPSDREFVRDRLETAFRSTGDGRCDVMYRICRQNDGQVRWVRSQGKTYFDERRQPVRFIGTALDVTEDVLTREELERLVAERTRELTHTNEQLRRSNEELEQFASVASHDLQEPLRKIQVFSDLILNSRGNPEVHKRYFPKIISAANRMSRLIRDVLQFARMNHSPEEFEEVDLQELLQQVLLDFEVLIDERKAVIHRSPLPAIWGHRSQLHQLFANLISNAIKFCTDKPEISVEARVFPTATRLSSLLVQPTEPVVEIRISDNGIGFDKKYSEQIFEIFQRLENSSRYSGTGIGLAICKKVVENHGGRIEVNSEPGKGTTFTILLPARERPLTISSANTAWPVRAAAGRPVDGAAEAP